MTNEMKKHISAIRNGTVPKGYKKTRLGIVPIDWEEVKFSTLFKAKSVFTDDLDSYPLCSLTIEEGIIEKPEQYERQHLVKKENSYKIMMPNEYAYNPMNIRFGAVARNKLNTPIAVSGYYDIFETVYKSDQLFFDNYLVSGFMLKYYDLVSTGSLEEKKRVHFSQFLNFCLPLPSIDERKRISEILCTQDKVIGLLERKLEELKKLKKAYLNKMFPKKGEKVPELRFKGFTGDWKQRKFSDFTFSAGEKNKRNLPLVPYAITNEHGFIAQSEAHDDFAYMKDVDRTMYIIVKPNSFAYNPARINVGSLGYYEGDENVIVSSLYEVFQTVDNVDDKFLSHWFKTKDFMDWISRLQEGSVRQYFYYDKLCECKMSIPSLGEQRKIGAYFDNLDNLITLHQRELDEEKRKKKALMQLLLTGKVRVKT